MDRNHVIIFPTDTLYAIGARMDDLEGIDRIYDLKDRDPKKKFVVLVYDLKDAERIAYIDDRARILIDKFLPGPLSIIVRTRPEFVSRHIGSTIGIRIPNHHLALQILKEYGPIANSSVNTSNEEPLNDYEEIYKRYHNKVDIIFPNYEKISGLNSSIVDLTAKRPKMIREGAITEREILEALGEKVED